MRNSMLRCASTCLNLALLTITACMHAETLLEQNFNGLAGVTLADPALGWTLQSGAIAVAELPGFGSAAVAGAAGAQAEYSVGSIAIRPQTGREKYVLTFRARATPDTHNSGLGFAALAADGTATTLAAWTRANGSWRFDVRGIAESIPGQRDLFPAVRANGVNETVTCRVVVDTGGHWVWGSVTGADGRTRNTHVFELPPARVNAVNALIMLQDSRSGSGPLDIDDIAVTRTPAPTLAGTTKADWEMPIRIVEYSWTTPDTTFVKHNIQMMEKRPLDGVCLRVPEPRFPYGTILSGTGRGGVGWAFFQNKRFARETVQAAIRDLEETEFHKFTHNYLVMVTYLPDKQVVNWYDDDWWGNVLHNTDLLAEFAAATNCEGIMFDPEEYGCKIWSAVDLLNEPVYQGRDYDQLAAKVRERGRSFIQTINRRFPAPQIFVLHAWEDVLRRVADNFERLRTDGGRMLTMAFLDGMLEASDPDTVIMDGIENGYYVETAADFAVKADRVRRYGPLLSAVPDAFRRKVRTATGIWLDRWRSWDPVDPEKNGWTPQGLEDVLVNALSANDGFIWLYLERPTFWLDASDAKLAGGVTPATGVGDYTSRNEEIKWVPPVYWEAVNRARARAQQARTGER